MPRKIHGQGGKTGHQSAETKGRVKKIYESNEKVKRAQAKRARLQERKIDIVASEIKHDIKPIAEKAYANALAKLKERGARPTALIKALAIDEWFIEQVLSALKKKKVLGGDITEADLETMHYLNGEERGKAYTHLLEGGRTAKQIQQEIEKWKRRVPGISKGHY